MSFEYILDKISSATISEYPFPHIEINSVFTEADFKAICSSPEIKIPAAKDDEELFERLFSSGYRVVEFPGCTTDYAEYLSWHRNKVKSQRSNTSCEGFGVVVRLEQIASDIVRDLYRFVRSDELASTIGRCFGVDIDACRYDAGIQKYMDGYEISPHPDLRRKAATFMVNLNPNPDSEQVDHHTYLMKFRDEWSYVEHFWKHNPNVDRCWVPWGWCDTVKKHVANNSMVIFAPSHDSLHAVRAEYNHLAYQRTQLYGNLWYEHVDVETRVRWEDLVVKSSLSQAPSKGARVLDKMRRIFTRNRGNSFKSSSRDGLNQLTESKK